MSARRRLRASLLALAAVAAAAPAPAAEIALSFHDAPGGSASGFRIERRAAGGKTFTPIALVGPGVVEFVDRSAGTGQLLCYRVRALASRSASDWSTEVCASAREPAPAVAPAVAPDAATGVGAGEAAGAGGEAAAASSAPQARRVRAGGGWLQVLD